MEKNHKSLEAWALEELVDILVLFDGEEDQDVVTLDHPPKPEEENALAEAADVDVPEGEKCEVFVGPPLVPCGDPPPNPMQEKEALAELESLLELFEDSEGENENSEDVGHYVTMTVTPIDENTPKPKESALPKLLHDTEDVQSSPVLTVQDQRETVLADELTDILALYETDDEVLITKSSSAVKTEVEICETEAKPKDDEIPSTSTATPKTEIIEKPLNITVVENRVNNATMCSEEENVIDESSDDDDLDDFLNFLDNLENFAPVPKIEKVEEIEVEDEEDEFVIHDVVSLKTFRFFRLPPVKIPPNAYDGAGFRGQLSCVDSFGYVYIGPWDRYADEIHAQMEAKLDAFYSSVPGSNMTVNFKDIKIGEILVGTVRTISEEHGPQRFFVRIMVTGVDEERWEVTGLDIESYRSYNFEARDVFHLIEFFYWFPMQGIKCVLADLETFLGTNAIADALMACEYDVFDFFVKIPDPSTDWAKDEVPHVELYYTVLDGEQDDHVPCFNQEVLQIISTWNEKPFNFYPDMVIENVRITWADEGGKIFVQIQSGVMKVLEKMKPLVSLTSLEPDDIFTTLFENLEEGKKAFVKKMEMIEEKYHRVEIIHRFQKKGRNEMKPRDKDEEMELMKADIFLVRHVDFGYEETLGADQLIPFDFFDKEMEGLQPQGFDARLQLGPEFEQGHPDQEIITAESIDWLTSPEQLCKLHHVYMTKDELPTVTAYFPRLANTYFLSPNPSPCPSLNRNRSTSAASSSSATSQGTGTGANTSAKVKIMYPLPIQQGLKKRPGAQFDYHERWRLTRAYYDSHYKKLNFDMLYSY